MEEFKITFWKEPFNSDNSFGKSIDFMTTSAIITKSIEKSTERYHVKLTDIGLDSLYGEFHILKINGRWQTSDLDSTEMNFLKWNIICEFENNLKYIKLKLNLKITFIIKNSSNNILSCCIHEYIIILENLNRT